MAVLCVQFAEKFAEYKEAARLAKEKSQEKMDMATSPSQVCSVHTILIPQSLNLFVSLLMTSCHRHIVYNEQLVNRPAKE